MPFKATTSWAMVAVKFDPCANVKVSEDCWKELDSFEETTNASVTS